MRSLSPLMLHLHHCLVVALLLLSFYHRFISSSHFSHSDHPHPAACTISNSISTVLYQHQPFFTFHSSLACSPHVVVLFFLPTPTPFWCKELNPSPMNFTICTPNTRSILTDSHSAALSGLICSHHPDLICLIETWIKLSTTPAEFFQCTIDGYTFLSFLRTPKGSDPDMKYNVGGGTGFLIREPCTEQAASLTQFSSFESSSVTLNLPHAKLFVSNI